MCPLNNNSKKCGRVVKWQEIERRKMKKSVSWGIKRKRQSYKFSDYLPLVLIYFYFIFCFLFFVGGGGGGEGSQYKSYSMSSNCKKNIPESYIMTKFTFCYLFLVCFSDYLPLVLAFFLFFLGGGGWFVMGGVGNSAQIQFCVPQHKRISQKMIM